MRTHIRHPSSFPVSIKLAADDRELVDRICNVSVAGLQVKLPHAIDEGTLVEVRITTITPVFSAAARTVWCHQTEADFEVGLHFLEPNDAFKVRMVAQICHIEEYRKSILARKGRHLTVEQAAREWIEKYADTFPS